MSTQCNTYVMLGAIFPFDPFINSYDQLEPFMDSAFKDIHNHLGLCVLYDGMSGDYVAIGRVLAKSNNHEPLRNPVVLRNRQGSANPLVVRYDDAMLSEIKNDIAHFIGSLVKLPTFLVEPIVLSHYR